MPVWPPFCDGVAGGVPHQAQGVRGLLDGPWEFPEVSGAPGTRPPTLGNQGGQAGALRAGARGFSVRVTGPVWAGPCSVSRPCSQAPPPSPALLQGHAAHTGRPACRTPGLGLPHTTPKAPRGTPNPGAQAGNLGNSWPCPGPPGLWLDVLGASLRCPVVNSASLTGSCRRPLPCSKATPAPLSSAFRPQLAARRYKAS